MLLAPMWLSSSSPCIIAVFVAIVVLTKTSAQDINGVSAEHRKIIVDTHNHLRSLMARGQIVSEVTGRRYPMAGGMRKLVWDEQLAEKAQRWSERCYNGQHRPSPHSHVGPDRIGGENLHWGRLNGVDVKRLTHGWFEEIYKPTFYGTGFLGPPSTVCNHRYGRIQGKMIGHATQTHWHDMSRIGCGLKSCHNIRTVKYTCHYANDEGRGGNFNNVPVYYPGKPCEYCGGSDGPNCDEGLCTTAATNPSKAECNEQRGIGQMDEVKKQTTDAPDVIQTPPIIAIEKEMEEAKEEEKEEVFDDKDDILAPPEGKDPIMGPIETRKDRNEVKVRVTTPEKYMFVDAVNYARTLIATGNQRGSDNQTLAAAGTMHWVKWSNYLEVFAEGVLKKTSCDRKFVGNDEQGPDNHATLLGEASMRGQKGVTHVVQSWKRTGTVTRSGVCSVEKGTPFTQLATDYVRRVGCAWKNCPNGRHVAACTFGSRRTAGKKWGGADLPESPLNYVFAVLPPYRSIYTPGLPAEFCMEGSSQLNSLCTSPVDFNKFGHAQARGDCKQRTTNASYAKAFPVNYTAISNTGDFDALLDFAPGDTSSGWYRKRDGTLEWDDARKTSSAPLVSWMMFALVFAHILVALR